MSRARLFAAVLIASIAAEVAARGGGTILTQPVSEPGASGELFVFVGEQMSYKPLDMSCDRCWVFDSWHTARYRVAQWIHGVPPGPELEFHVAEHSVRIPFGHSRYALVFVERMGDSLQLVKYQQEPVYPTADGSFASCGPMGGGPEVAGRPLEPGSPPLRDVAFSPRLVVDDARRLSALGRKTAHDPRWHEVVGDQVVCRRGVPVDELVTATVRGHSTLRTALPELAGAAP